MATFDRRRIQGPEVSYAPIYEDEPEAGPSTRSDRANDEARPICELDFGFGCASNLIVLTVCSPQDRLGQPSEWQWLHRSRRSKDRMLSVGRHLDSFTTELIAQIRPSPATTALFP
jgi:hypothetical protein